MNKEHRLKLLDIIKKYFDIVENKKTDGTTKGEKEKAWKEIKKEMIAATNGDWTNMCPKTTWTNIKLQARKYRAKMTKELYKTGGGRSMAPVRGEFLDMVVSLIGKSAVGINYPGDSDNLPPTICTLRPSTNSSLQSSTSSSSFPYKIRTIDDLIQSDESDDIDDPAPIFKSLRTEGDIVSWGNDGGPSNLRKPMSEPLRNILIYK
ncbi:uncharacterized protein [Prorops nasuta]|uniref:uncharacterized protein n=1 Tax=Prorops nasuta TaxID=863751 RepID=UPI0034CE250E